ARDGLLAWQHAVLGTSPRLFLVLTDRRRPLPPPPILLLSLGLAVIAHEGARLAHGQVRTLLDDFILCWMGRERLEHAEFRGRPLNFLVFPRAIDAAAPIQSVG